MNQLNPKMFDVNVMDGPAFITMLQKLGRMCGDVLLGVATDDSITLEKLQIVKEVAPGTSAGSSSLSRTSSSLPIISPSKRSDGRSLFDGSPSADTHATLSGRGVTRGVGPDNGFIFSHEGFFDDCAGSIGGGTISTYGASHLYDNDDQTRASISDPYIAYMRLSPAIMSEFSPPSAQSQSSAPFSPARFSSSHTSAGHRSPAPLLAPIRASTSHEYRSDGTDGSVTSELTYSPINSATSKFRPKSLASTLNQTSTSVSSAATANTSSSMVSSLIGVNPWSEKLEEQKRRNREKKIQLHSTV
jgi:hypothetical protein